MMHLTYKCMFACVYVCVQVHAHMHIRVSWGRILWAVAVGRDQDSNPFTNSSAGNNGEQSYHGTSTGLWTKRCEIAFQCSHWLLHGTCNATFLRPTLMTHELNMPSKITISAAYAIIGELIINWDSMFESTPWARMSSINNILFSYSEHQRKLWWKS